MPKKPLDTMAWEYALVAHDGQKDKAGKPYMLHLRRVARAIDDYCDTQITMTLADKRNLVAIATLHDVIEDTDTVPQDLLDYGFTNRVVSAVCVLTRGKNQDTYYECVRRNPDALLVKLADIGDNMNPLRLQLLDVETRLRLVRKYSKALTELLG